MKQRVARSTWVITYTRFFLPRKGVHLVKLDDREGMLPVAGGNWWRVRQRSSIGGHLVGHCLVDDAQLAGDAAQIHPTHIPAQRLPTGCLVIALWSRMRGVLALAEHAQRAVAPRGIAPDFQLARAGPTMRAGNCFHTGYVTTYPIF